MILDDFPQISCEKTPQSRPECRELPNTYRKTCTNHVRTVRTPKRLQIFKRRKNILSSSKNEKFPKRFYFLKIDVLALSHTKYELLTRSIKQVTSKMADLEALAMRATRSAKCIPTDRALWPEICEERMGRNLTRLKALVAELEVA